MNTIRRMIKAFADGMYPPLDEPRLVGTERYEIGQDKVLNRIKLFLLDRCPSKSRAERLAHAVRDICDRASTGAHNDITKVEARSLFLATYSTLGEVLFATDAAA